MELVQQQPAPKALYSVYDLKSQTYSQPFPAKNHADALRGFSVEVNNQKSQINQFPEDFCLYYLGTYDENFGKLEAVMPTLLGNATQYKKILGEN